MPTPFLFVDCHASVALRRSRLRTAPVRLAALVLTSLVLPFFSAGHCGAAAASGRLVFERDIRPILKANCFDCHGETEKPKGGLDLRLKRLMVQGGESGPAVVAGKPERSRLIEKVRSGEMPKREKKLTPAEIGLLEQWIRSGAQTSRPEPSTLPPGMTFSEEERAHWAYQPIKRVPPPATQREDRARSPIDAFLLQPLKSQGLRFAPDATRVQLLRRLHIDLSGLPPTPDDLARFLSDTSPDAYEQEIARLLERPQYGERWGRHWLDAAGYADSEGFTPEDPLRDYAYKYRDYVIRSFNADKPFNQFVTEQLAGDELVRPPYKNLKVEDLDKLVATGFLRMSPDGTAAAADQNVARNAVVSDTLKIVTSSLMGLTVGCAQCHDHRYDPIPQTDYYRLRALFEPAYDWKHWRSPRERLISLYTDADRAQAAAIEAEAQKLAADHAARQSKFLQAAFDKELEKFDASLRPKLRLAYETAGDKRTPEQQKLLAENPSVNISPGTLYQYNAAAAEELKALDAKIAEIRSRKPVEDFISVLNEIPGTLPVTYRFHRGDPQQPQEAIAPGTLSVLGPGGQPLPIPPKAEGMESSGRRLAFARWLTQTNNPLLARVIVNRVWMHHFGRGLVGTPADFGTMGEKPSHPELLDWLAGEFIADGWSLKRLHTRILTSTAYRQASTAPTAPVARAAKNAKPVKSNAGDPAYYSRKPLQRLDAEIVRDSILAVSGSLNPKMYGPPVPVRPDVTGQIVVGIDKTSGDNKMPVTVSLQGEEYRRSVYIQVRRSQPLALLNLFDAPAMELNCERRQASTSAPQSLMLMNSEFILEQAERFAQRLIREEGPVPRRQIERAWLLAFSRLPTESERQHAEAFLQKRTQQLQDPAGSGATEVKSGKPAPGEMALRSLCQTLFSSNEFLYVD